MWSGRMVTKVMPTCAVSWDHLVLKYYLAPSFMGPEAVVQSDGDLVTYEQGDEVLLEILT